MQNKKVLTAGLRHTRFLVQKVNEQLPCEASGTDWANPICVAKTARHLAEKTLAEEDASFAVADRFCRLLSIHRTLHEAYDTNWKKTGAPVLKETEAWRVLVASLLSLAIHGGAAHRARSLKYLNAVFTALDAWEQAIPDSETQDEMAALADEVWVEVIA